MATMNPISQLTEGTKRAYGLLKNDLQAIPDDKLGACPGGCANSALRIVAECAAVNGGVADFLVTGAFNRPPHDEFAAFLNTFDTREKTLAFLDERTEKLLSVLAELDESTLGDVTSGFFNRPMTRYAIAQLPTGHMMYHDGQLNLIQMLHGDSEMHW